MGVFENGSANAANRILPRLTLVEMETKFGIKSAITTGRSKKRIPSFIFEITSVIQHRF